MSLPEEFRGVGSDAQLMQLLARYGFQEMVASERWNLGEYELKSEGSVYRIGYRWYDPSQAFSIQKDIHKAELWLTDSNQRATTLASISFPEDA